jgi:hypothetical protein
MYPQAKSTVIPVGSTASLIATEGQLLCPQIARFFRALLALYLPVSPSLFLALSVYLSLSRSLCLALPVSRSLFLALSVSFGLLQSLSVSLFSLALSCLLSGALSHARTHAKPDSWCAGRARGAVFGRDEAELLLSAILIDTANLDPTKAKLLDQDTQVPCLCLCVGPYV